MGAAADPLSLAATGLSALGSYSSGRTAASNARSAGQSSALSAFMTAAQAEAAAAAGEIKASETDRFMRDRTQGALANIDAVLALTGKTDDSPTSWAVKNRFEYLSDEARTTATGNLRREAASLRNQKALYLMSGMNAIKAADENARNLEISGLLGGVGSIFKGAAGAKLEGALPKKSSQIDWMWS